MPRPFRRRRTTQVAIVLALLALAAARFAASRLSPEAPESLAEGSYEADRVVDGDTLLLVGGARVRLQGIDCPESVRPNHPVEPWGPEAAEFTRQFIAGRSVYLRFDKERRDRFGRFLAYVYVDELLLNEELVRAGLATAETQYHFSGAIKRRLLAAQDEAKRGRRGIWSQGKPTEP